MKKSDFIKELMIYLKINDVMHIFNKKDRRDIAEVVWKANRDLIESTELSKGEYLEINLVF